MHTARSLAREGRKGQNRARSAGQRSRAAFLPAGPDASAPGGAASHSVSDDPRYPEKWATLAYQIAVNYFVYDLMH
jgi:hypothetical protein